MNDDCTCNIDVDIDETYCEFESETLTKKGYKRIKCHECGDKILAGDKYEHARGREGYEDDYPEGDNESGWTVHITCDACRQVRDTLFCSWFFGMVWETLHEQFVEAGVSVSTACLDKIGPEGREKLSIAMQKAHNERVEDES